LNSNPVLSDKPLEMVSNRKDIMKRRSKLRLSCQPSHDAVGDYVSYLKKGGTVNNPCVLKSFLNTLPRKELISLAMEMKDSKKRNFDDQTELDKKLKHAFRRLPDLTYLVELLCFERCSEIWQAKLHLSNLPIDDLLRIAHVIPDKIATHKNAVMIVKALADDNPQKALVEYIFSEPALKEKALNWRGVQDGIDKRMKRLMKMKSVGECHNDTSRSLDHSAPPQSGRDGEPISMKCLNASKRVSFSDISEKKV